MPTKVQHESSIILLDVDGDLRDPQNEKLRTLTTATTLTLLRDPNLDGERRSQVMRFLRRLKLVDRDTAYGPNRPDDMVAILNFSEADLLKADLSNTLLNKTFLSGANLIEANLSGASLIEANLIEANLSGAYLSGANLSGANLSGANLSGANLSGANLSRAVLIEANLSGAVLIEAYLCGTQLPKTIALDPDRDCEVLKQRYPW